MNTKEAYALRAEAVLFLRQGGFKVRELAVIFKTTPWPIRKLTQRGLRIERRPAGTVGSRDPVDISPSNA